MARRTWLFVTTTVAVVLISIFFALRSHRVEDDLSFGYGQQEIVFHSCQGVVGVSHRYEQRGAAELFDWRTQATSLYQLSDECENYAYGFGADRREAHFRDGRVIRRSVVLMPIWFVGSCGLIAVFVFWLVIKRFSRAA